MEDWSTCEKLSIRESAKTLKKYGSTSRHVSRNQNYIKHVVTTSDTLQGIALKYGVTMEQIRRANRLWATDSLFLRESLLIPASDNCELPSSQEQDLVNNHQEISSPSSCEDVYSFLVKIDNSVANTKKEVKKSRRNSEFAPSIESNFDSERKKTPVSRMKQSTNNNSEEMLAAPQAVIMSTSRGRKLRSSLQKLEQEQDELFEL